MNHVFEIDDGEQTWIVAETKDEALREYLKAFVNKVPDDLTTIDSKYLHCLLDEIKVTQWEDDSVLKVYDEDDRVMQEKTAAEWAAEGKCIIACTC